MTLGEVFGKIFSAFLVFMMIVLFAAVAGYQPAKDFLSSGGPVGCYSTSRFGACE